MDPEGKGKHGVTASSLCPKNTICANLINGKPHQIRQEQEREREGDREMECQIEVEAKLRHQRGPDTAARTCQMGLGHKFHYKASKAS